MLAGLRTHVGGPSWGVKGAYGVNDRPGVAEAWRELTQAQKPGAGVPWYMRVVNRKLGRGIAALASPTPLTPNAITGLSFAAFLGGAGLLAAVEPSIWSAIAATLLLQLGFALDAADGQLSRLRGTGSKAGEWLDHVVDAARHQAFHLAVAIGLFRFTDVDAWVLLIPLFFSIAASVRFFAQILAEQLARRDASTAAANVPKFGTWIQAPADTGLNNLVVLLWPWTTPFLIAYAVFGVLNTLLLGATLVRRYRELERLT